MTSPQLKGSAPCKTKVAIKESPLLRNNEGKLHLCTDLHIRNLTYIRFISSSSLCVIYENWGEIKLFQCWLKVYMSKKIITRIHYNGKICHINIKNSPKAASFLFFF